MCNKAYTGFGAGFIDYDNDGRLDLFIANGAVTLREEQRGSPPPYKEKNLLLHNEGGKFADVTDGAGSAFRLLEVTRGAAFGDIDNDGRVDIVITNNNGPARLLLNRTTPAGWLAIQLDGGGNMNRDALGARVTVHRSGLPDLAGRVHTPIVRRAIGAYTSGWAAARLSIGSRLRGPGARPNVGMHALLTRPSS